MLNKPVAVTHRMKLEHFNYFELKIVKVLFVQKEESIKYLHLIIVKHEVFN